MKYIKDNNLMDIKEDELSFLNTIFSYGLVIRASVDDIQALKKAIIKNYPDVKIIYQRISVDKLKIIVEA